MRQLDRAPCGHVKVFDGRSGTEIAGFFASEGFTSGVTVAVGDVRGEVVVGTTAVTSHVKAFDVVTGATLLTFLALEASQGRQSARKRAAHW